MDTKKRIEELKKEQQINPKSVVNELLKIQSSLSDSKDSDDYFSCSMLLSDTYSHLGDYQKALGILDELEDYAKDDLRKQANIANYRGNTFWYQSKYLMALEEYLKVKERAEKIKDKSLLHASYNNIGMILWIQEDYEAAIENYKKAFELLDKKDSHHAANSMNNIGLCYIRLDNLPEAVKNLEAALKIFEKENDLKLTANSYMNLANVKMEMDDIEGTLNYMKKALKIKEKIADKWGICYCLSSISRIYLQLEKVKETGSTIKKAIELAEELDSLDHKKSCYLTASGYYELKNEYQKALDYFKKYSVIESEMNQNEAQKKLVELRKNYEIKEKEKENEIFKLKNIELKKKNDLISKQKKQLDDAMIQLKKLNENLQEELQTQLDNIRKKDQMLSLQSKQASMGEMIACIAHQWKQPLNGIGLLTQDMIDAWDYNELDENYLKKSTAKILDLVEFMSITINDFRDFFKPEIEATDFNLKDVVNKTLKFVEFSLKKSNINLELDLKDISIHGFPNYYSQVVMNIINNARDVLIERNIAEPCIKISSFFSDSNKRAVLTIEDNAGGINKDTINKIFNPYFTTKPKEKGTGLGLYMSKVIIETNMHGNISAENVPSGACFKIEI